MQEVKKSMEKSTCNTNSVKAWVLAARPKTLTGAVAPVLVGGAMAFVLTCSRVIRKNIDMYEGLNLSDTILQGRLVSVLVPFGLCLLFALLMQVDANFINDYFDFKKGTDREDRLGPERACAQGWITPRAMQIGIVVTTFLSCCVGILILLWHMQFELIIVGILCVVFCFLYTTRLSYLGWGDVLVLVFFGIVPVVFTYYVMTNGDFSSPLGEGRVEASVILASVAMGLATDNLLMVNNYRDRNQDRISGKRTLVVRTIDRQIKKHGTQQGQLRGERICRAYYLWIGILATLLAFISLFLFPFTNWLHQAEGASPFTFHASFSLLLIYLILHLLAYSKLKKLDGKALNQLLGTTARNIFLFGLLLAASVLLS